MTDHGVLQSFPSAFRAAKGKIKLIPGCEGYLIDEKAVVDGADGRLKEVDTIYAKKEKEIMEV